MVGYNGQQLDGINTVFVRDCPNVQADCGMVFVEATSGRPGRWTLSPHLALVFAGALRQAAYEAMEDEPAPVCTVVRVEREH